MLFEVYSNTGGLSFTGETEEICMGTVSWSINLILHVFAPC